MNSTILKELIALTLIILAILLFNASIAPMAYVICYLVVVGMFLVFIFSIVRSKDIDERDKQHRVMAADSGFVAAGVVILIAVAYQTWMNHVVDMWLFVTLVAMLTTRLSVRIYLDKRQ